MSDLAFTIVAPDSDDVVLMNAMWAQSWLDTYSNDAFGVSREWVEAKVSDWGNEESLKKRRKQIIESKDDPDKLWRVAKSSTGEIIGIIAPYRDGIAQRVGAIYVDKRYYGKGVAQVLMEEVLDWADPMRQLELEVATYNERAKAFYRKYGFEEVIGSEHKVHGIIPVVKMIRKGDKR